MDLSTAIAQVLHTDLHKVVEDIEPNSHHTTSSLAAAQSNPHDATASSTSHSTNPSSLLLLDLPEDLLLRCQGWQLSDVRFTAQIERKVREQKDRQAQQQAANEAAAAAAKKEAYARAELLKRNKPTRKRSRNEPVLQPRSLLVGAPNLSTEMSHSMKVQSSVINVFSSSNGASEIAQPSVVPDVLPMFEHSFAPIDKPANTATVNEDNSRNTADSMSLIGESCAAEVDVDDSHEANDPQENAESVAPTEANTNANAQDEEDEGDDWLDDFGDQLISELDHAEPNDYTPDALDAPQSVSTTTSNLNSEVPLTTTMSPLKLNKDDDEYEEEMEKEITELDSGLVVEPACQSFMTSAPSPVVPAKSAASLSRQSAVDAKPIATSKKKKNRNSKQSVVSRIYAHNKTAVNSERKKLQKKTRQQQQQTNSAQQPVVTLNEITNVTNVSNRNDSSVCGIDVNNMPGTTDELNGSHSPIMDQILLPMTARVSSNITEHVPPEPSVRLRELLRSHEPPEVVPGSVELPDISLLTLEDEPMERPLLDASTSSSSSSKQLDVERLPLPCLPLFFQRRFLSERTRSWHSRTGDVELQRMQMQTLMNLDDIHSVNKDGCPNLPAASYHPDVLHITIPRVRSTSHRLAIHDAPSDVPADVAAFIETAKSINEQMLLDLELETQAPQAESLLCVLNNDASVVARSWTDGRISIDRICKEELLHYAELECEGALILAACFSSSSTHLVTGTLRGVIALWDIQWRRRCESYVSPHGQEAVWDIQFCPRDAYFTVASADGTCSLWRTDRKMPLRWFVPGSNVNLRDLMPIIASTTTLFPPSTNQPQSKQPKQQPLGVTVRALVHPSYRYVLTVSWGADGGVFLWEIATAKCVRRFTVATTCASRDDISDVALSPDGTQMVTTSVTGVLLLWTLPSTRSSNSGHEKSKPDDQLNQPVFLMSDLSSDIRRRYRVCWSQYDSIVTHVSPLGQVQCFDVHFPHRTLDESKITPSRWRYALTAPISLFDPSDNAVTQPPTVCATTFTTRNVLVTFTLSTDK